VIGPSEVEYETRERVDGSDGIADGALFVHIGCFTAWLSESRALAPPPAQIHCGRSESAG
jgi:hypothetical protein